MLPAFLSLLHRRMPHYRSAVGVAAVEAAKHREAAPDR